MKTTFFRNICLLKIRFSSVRWKCYLSRLRFAHTKTTIAVAMSNSAKTPVYIPARTLYNQMSNDGVAALRIQL